MTSSPVSSSPITRWSNFEIPAEKNQNAQKTQTAALEQLKNISETGPVGKFLISPFEGLDENGIPVRNNREKLQCLQDKILPPENLQLAELNDLCLHARLRNSNSTTREHRDETIGLIRKIVAARLITVNDAGDNFGSDYVVEFVEKVGLLSPSVSTLLWVHFALWGVSLKNCGTQKHIDAYLEKSNSLEILGCLMMTEIGHGSNVVGLETEATYDPGTRGFYLNSPTKTSMKIWAGGTVENASHGVVFAKMIIDGKSMGVHAFVVQLRENGKNLPGISTWDLNRKMGLNGIDNGIVQFDRVWIPYDNLLDKYCEVTPDGIYVHKEGNRDSQKLIYRLMSQFVRGRQIIGISSTAAHKFLTTIFYCYPPVTVSKSLHRKLLTDKICRAYALEFAKPIYLGKYVNDHIRGSLAKAVFSEMAMEEYRDTLMWYSNVATRHVAAVIEDYRKDCFATTIYEGVNEVLLQMGAQAAMKEVGKCYGTWMADLKGLKFSALKTIVEYAWNRGDPLYILKWELLEMTKSINSRMKGCKTPAEMFDRWSKECQVDGIQLARIYTQTLVIEQFIRKSHSLDLEQGTNIWTTLSKIYAWNMCTTLISHQIKPDLSREFAAIEMHIPALVAQLGMRVKYLDALMNPPAESIPFDTSDNAAVLAHIFRSAL